MRVTERLVTRFTFDYRITTSIPVSYQGKKPKGQLSGFTVLVYGMTPSDMAERGLSGYWPAVKACERIGLDMNHYSASLKMLRRIH